MTEPPTGRRLFDTAIGPVGVAWGHRGLVAVQLPEASGEATARRLGRRAGDLFEVPADSGTALPAAVRKAIDAMTRLLAGEPVDLQDAPLDLERVPELDRRVYQIARTIPPGATLTYGAIAVRLGQPGAAREVGQALGRNPWPLVVPCHRVVAAGGKLGGFSAAQGTVTKRRLLEIEGAWVETLPLFDRSSSSR